tara:strand:- start:257 stop:493 length:237 start_codon:yes stop_codon:yes gene_type:complete
MGICYSRYYQCDNCQRILHKDGPKILYSFHGCGKYHNKLMCDECLYDKLGFEIQNTHDILTDNPDPLGMNIYIKKRLT